MLKKGKKNTVHPPVGTEVEKQTARQRSIHYCCIKEVVGFNCSAVVWKELGVMAVNICFT